MAITKSTRLALTMTDAALAAEITRLMAIAFRELLAEDRANRTDTKEA